MRKIFFINIKKHKIKKKSLFFSELNIMLIVKMLKKGWKYERATWSYY